MTGGSPAVGGRAVSRLGARICGGQISGFWFFGGGGVLAVGPIVAPPGAVCAMFKGGRPFARRYGAEYEAYRRAVPAWLPRLTPWQG